MWERGEYVDQTVHDCARLPVVIAQKDRKTAHTLHQRCDVCLAELLAELDQIALPVAELVSLPNDVLTVQNAQFRAESAAMTTPGIPRPASSTAFRQIALQFHFLAIVRVGKAVDRLVADADAAPFIS